jgi:hypothetical protein
MFPLLMVLYRFSDRTIPMAFIVSLTSAEAIGDKIKFIGRILERHPFIADVLTQLAPLILIAVNELLKIFLEIFSMLEGPISGAVVEASMFQKLTIFMVRIREASVWLHTSM